jgi:hypothetical protein
VLYRNNRNGTFTDVTAVTGVGGNNEDTFGGVWADYDGDGDNDLFVHYDTSGNRLFRNVGNVFVDVTPSMMVDPSVRSWGATWSDYDCDGDFDLFVSTLGSACRLFQNIGAGRFIDVAVPAGVNLTGSQTGNVFGDFDADGDVDLYMSAFDEPALHLDNLTGVAFYRSGKAAYSTQGRSVSAADYDADGDLDLALISGSQANALFATSGVSNAWIRLKLQGTFSNRAAIGATVRLKSAGRRQIQMVSGGSGYISQNDQALFFGLGNTAGPDTFEVRWPTGAVQTVTGLTRNMSHTIVETVEPVAGAEPPPPPPASLFLSPNRPNPFRLTTSIEFQLPIAGPVRLEILDVQGRRVATLIDAPLNAGMHQRDWDGRAGNGGRTAAGVYFYRLTTTAGAATRKLLLQP